MNAKELFELADTAEAAISDLGHLLDKLYDALADEMNRE